MGGNRPTQRRALALCDSNVVAEPGWSLGSCLCREFPVSPVGPPGPAVGALRTGIVASLGGDGQSRQWRTPPRSASGFGTSALEARTKLHSLRARYGQFRSCWHKGARCESRIFHRSSCPLNFQAPIWEVLEAACRLCAASPTAPAWAPSRLGSLTDLTQWGSLL